MGRKKISVIFPGRQSLCVADRDSSCQGDPTEKGLPRDGEKHGVGVRYRNSPTDIVVLRLKVLKVTMMQT